MDIILQGRYTEAEAVEAIRSVLVLLAERYQVTACREMHLTLTLMNQQGEDVELVDTKTGQVYRIFEIHRSEKELSTHKRPFGGLKLVIDNTR